MTSNMATSSQGSTIPSAHEKHAENDAQPGLAAPAASAPIDPGPPPNGGVRAWLYVLGGFMLFFNSWGILNAFGVFQTYYESGALFTKSSSDIAWIGAIQACLVLLVGLFAGPIYDRGYLRTLLVVGSFGVVFGHMMLSICKTYWQVLLAQGFCVGIGAGCLFVPCVSVLPTYFSSRIGLAVGLASSGSSLGGIIYPIVLYQLIDRIGFGWSVRVMGFIALATLLIPVTVMRMRFKSPKPRKLIDLAAFADLPYMLFTVATLIGFIGLNVIIFYISFYPANRHFTDTRLAFYMVPIYNAGSYFGRTIPNALSDKLGPLNIITPCALISGVLMLCMIAVRSSAAMIVLASFAGFFTGVFLAMPPVCFARLTKDKSMIGTRIGMGFAIVSLAMLIGGPGGGGILGQVDPLNWTGLWVFGGATACVAGLMYSLLRVRTSGFKFMVRV
ncbi:MAG: hypothetical protein Q9165_005550 [Trypethelium subeluteriae]